MVFVFVFLVSDLCVYIYIEREREREMSDYICHIHLPQCPLCSLNSRTGRPASGRFTWESSRLFLLRPFFLLFCFVLLVVDDGFCFCFLSVRFIYVYMSYYVCYIPLPQCPLCWLNGRIGRPARPADLPGSPRRP